MATSEKHHSSHCVCAGMYSVLLHLQFYCKDAHFKMFMDSSSVLVRKGMGTEM